MNKDSINEFIKNYIKNYKLKSAIMLSGDWGIGKSYYIENSLAPYLKEQISNQFQCIIISLYGIKSIDEISKQLFFEINFNKLSKPIRTATNVGKTIAKGVSSFFNITIDFNDTTFQGIFKILKLKNKLIIFEDIERINPAINITTFLGYVNSFVEHDGVKVLLVANEDEILKHVQNDTNVVETDVSKEYKRIKEKTVSDTLYFTPNNKESLITISKLFDTKLRDIIIEDNTLDTISVLMQAYHHNNLRSLIYAFQKTEDLLNLLKEEELVDDIKKEILLSCIKVTLGLKSCSHENLDTIDYFAFCAQYITNNIFDIEDCRKQIKHKQNEIKRLGDSKDTDLANIQCYNILTEQIVLDSINNVEKKLQADKIGYFQYPIIASLLTKLKYIVKLNFNLDSIKTIMIHNLLHTDVDLSGNNLLRYEPSDLLTPEQKIFLEDLKNAILANNHFRMHFKNLEELCELISTRREKIISQKKFFCDLDISLLITLINQASSKDLTNFIASINYLYSFSNVQQFFSDDIKAIQKLIETLNSTLIDPNTDLIKIYNINILIITLQNIYNRLTNNSKLA